MQKYTDSPVTVPVYPVTVAVNVTLWPDAEGLVPDVTPVVVGVSTVTVGEVARVVSVPDERDISEALKAAEPDADGAVTPEDPPPAPYVMVQVAPPLRLTPVTLTVHGPVPLNDGVAPQFDVVYPAVPEAPCGAVHPVGTWSVS